MQRITAEQLVEALEELAEEVVPQYKKFLDSDVIYPFREQEITLLKRLAVAYGRIDEYPKSIKICEMLLRSLRVVRRCYVELFRGTPMIVQAVVIYYGLLQVFGIKMGMWTAGFFIVSINTGAYMAETVRGGIVSIDPGQTEGAMAIGMNHWQTMLHVILPQALRNIMPQIGNNFIINIKDTSVLSVISITDLFFVHKSVVGALYTYFESAVIVMIIYLSMTLLASYLLRAWEKALDGPQNYDLNTTDTLAYTSGMYNAPDPDHKSQNLDMKGDASHV